MEILSSVGCRVPYTAYRMMNCFNYKKTSTESVCLVEKVDVKYLLQTFSSQTSKSNHSVSGLIFSEVVFVNNKNSSQCNSYIKLIS